MSATVEETTPETAAPLPDTDNPRIRGVATEAKLREWDIAYEYVEAMSVADIRVVEVAQVRDAGHIANNDVVEEYAEHMRNGAVFPPLLVHGDSLLLDGNTRLAAAKKVRRKMFPVFRAQFPNLELGRTFAASMNQQNGKRLTPAEAHRAAINLLKFGHTEEAVARELGYSRQHIANWRRETEFQKRAEAAMIVGAATAVAKLDQRKLADIKLTSPFASAVELVSELKPSPKDVTALVKEVKEAPTESDALQIVADKRKALAAAGPPPHRPAAPKELSTIRRALPLLLNNADNPLLLIESDSAKRDEAIKEWERLRLLSDQVLQLYRG